AALQIAGAVSLETWFKTTKTNHSDAGLAGYGLVSNIQLTLHFSTIYCYVLKNGGANYLAYSSASLVDGTWHSATCTWDGTTNAGGFKLYVDGVLRTSRASTTAVAGSWPAFQIGHASTYFQGSLDDTAVYPAALTAAQVLAHH